MIPLGSCTMKLNATTEMMPITWPEFGAHPSVRAAGPGGGLSTAARASLRRWLAEITGFDGDLAAAERRQPGRVRGAADHPEVSCRARPGAPQDLSDPSLGARHQSGKRAHRGPARWSSSGAMPAATSTSRTSRAKAERAQRRSGGADDHLSLDPWRVRGGDPGHLRGGARATAGRSTWTAPT